MKAWFLSLAPRERLMVSVATAVVSLALIFLLAWEPLASRVAQLQQSVEEKQALKQWMRQASAEARRLRGVAAGASDAGNNRSLLAVVDQTSKQAQLGSAVKRIQPDGQDLVRVNLEQAAFDDVVMWLGNLQRSYGVKVVDAALDRQADAGRVNARLTLKKGGS